MILLAPSAAIVAACVALPTLVALYVLKLRRRPLRVSSTHLWESAVRDAQVNVPLRRLRASLLMLVHALILACLVLAIGRPALQDGGVPGGRAVILIEHSAAMNAADAPGGVTRLEHARARARELVGSMRSAGTGELLIASFAGTARARTGFSADARTLIEAIDAIETTDQPADLDPALRLVGALAGDRASEQGRPEDLSVLLLGTGAYGPRTGAPAARGLDVRLLRAGPVPESAADNLGITALSARRDDQDPAMVRVFVRVTSAAGTPLSTPVSVALDNQTLSTRTLEIPAGTSDEPGHAGVTLSVPTTAGGVLTVRLDRPDALDADNTASVVLAPAGRPRVVLVAPGVDGTEADPFLLGALRAYGPGEVRVIDAGQYAAQARSVPGAPPARSIGDIVFFDRVTPASVPLVPSVSFGAAPPITGLKLQGPTGAPPVRLISWRRAHPLLRHVALETLLASPATLTIPGSDDGAIIPADAPGVHGLSLGETPAGSAMALVTAQGVRHVVVASQLARTNWGPHVSFPLFIASCVEQLTLRASASAGRSFTTREPVRVSAAPGTTEITLTRAGTPVRRVPVPVPAPDTGEQIIDLGVLERAGVYTLTGARDTPALAVNLLDTPSTLARTSDELALVRSPAPGTAPGGSIPREIWPWAVLAVAGLLVVEWGLFVRSVRQ